MSREEQREEACGGERGRDQGGGVVGHPIGCAEAHQTDKSGFATNNKTVTPPQILSPVFVTLQVQNLFGFRRFTVT